MKIEITDKNLLDKLGDTSSLDNFSSSELSTLIPLILLLASKGEE